MVDIDEMLYIFGGIDQKGKYLNDLHSYDTKMLLWSKILSINGVVPQGRQVFNMYVYNKKLYVQGGLSSNGPLNDLWSFDTISYTWKCLD